MKVLTVLLLSFLGSALAQDLFVTSDRENCNCCQPPCCCKCVERVIPGTGTTPPPTTTVRECDKVLDLCIILDGSGSIGSSDWAKAKDFVINFVSEFDIGLDKVRVSLIEYSTDYSVQWLLDGAENTDLSTLTTAISAVDHTQGWTDTVSGMQAAIKYVFVAPGDRPEAPNAGVVITDGRNNRRKDELEAIATALQGVAWVAAVGVSNKTNNTELNIIATGPDDSNVFLVDDFNGLSAILEPLAMDICDEIPTDTPSTQPSQPDIIQRQCVCCCPRYWYGGTYGHNEECC